MIPRQKGNILKAKICGKSNRYVLLSTSGFLAIQTHPWTTDSCVRGHIN